MLTQSTERARQLDDRTRAQAARAARSPLIVALVGGMLSAPALGLLALLLHFVNVGLADPLLAAVCAGPALATPIVVAALLFALMARRGSLADAAAAAPAPAAGEPMVCRVCGGDLESGSGAVARCGYCKADNVVRPEVVARMASKHEAALGDLEAEVSARASTLRHSAGGATLVALITAITAPLAGLAFTLLLATTMSATEIATDGSERVAIVEDAHGRCFAERRGTAAEPLLWRGGRADVGFAAPIPLSDEAAYTWVSTSSQIGQRVRVPPDGAQGVIEGVLRTALVEHDLARVRTSSGVRDAPFGGLCLLD